MCGILGQIKCDHNISKDIGKFNAALHLLHHRGPDDCGVICSDNFIFGHKRLSIVDLSSKARQPMTTEDEKAVIVFRTHRRRLNMVENDVTIRLIRNQINNPVHCHSLAVQVQPAVLRMTGQFS